MTTTKKRTKTTRKPQSKIKKLQKQFSVAKIFGLWIPWLIGANVIFSSLIQSVNYTFHQANQNNENLVNVIDGVNE